MRKLREVLRLRFELKLGYQQIGRSCSIGVSTVHKYLKLAEAAGISWPLPEGWDEAQLEPKVFPQRKPSLAERNPARTPDYAVIHEQLRGNKHVTLNCCGKNTGRQIQTVTATHASASCTNDGARNWTWCCGRSTSPARRCSWIGPARPSRYMTATPVLLGNRRCS